MQTNCLEIEWTDTGCTAKASGFKGVLLTCPRCKEAVVIVVYASGLCRGKKGAL